MFLGKFPLHLYALPLHELQVDYRGFLVFLVRFLLKYEPKVVSGDESKV
jgi:hypothetical protein